jgi:hypothetical protein
LATLDIPDKPRILGNLYSCMGITYMELGKLTLAAIHHRKDLDIAVKYNYKVCGCELSPLFSLCLSSRCVF